MTGLPELIDDLYRSVVHAYHAPIALVISAAGFFVDVALFRFGELAQQHSLLQCIRWRLVIANGLTAASICMGLACLRADMTISGLCWLGVSITGLAFSAYWRPIPGARLARVHTTSIAWIVVLGATMIVAGLAFATVSSGPDSVPAGVDVRTLHVRASLFGVLFGGLVLFVAGILVPGSVSLPSLFLQLLGALVTGASAAMTTFGAAVVVFVPEFDEVALVLTLIPGAFLILATALLVFHLAGKIPAMRTTDMTGGGPAMPPPSKLKDVLEGKKKGLAESTNEVYWEQYFLLADCIVWAIYQRPGNPKHSRTASRGAVAQCSQEYLRSRFADPEDRGSLHESVLSGLLIPHWVVEDHDRYALTPFAVRVLQASSPTDTKLLLFVQSFWKQQMSE